MLEMRGLPAQEAAGIAAESVAALSAEFGPPPYRELDVVEAVVPIGGYEYPGLVLFDGAARANAQRASMEFLIPHEIAHQWFYALVGNDVTAEPWLDEGLATFAQLRFLARARGAEAAQAQQQRWEQEYGGVLARVPIGVNRSIYGYTNWLDYRGPTYYAGALLFERLRQQLGDEPFQQGMGRLLTQFAFGEATTAEVQAIFNGVAAEAGLSLDDVWERWLE